MSEEGDKCFADVYQEQIIKQWSFINNQNYSREDILLAHEYDRQNKTIFSKGKKIFISMNISCRVFLIPYILVTVESSEWSFSVNKS